MSGIVHLSWLPEPSRWLGIANKLRQMARAAADAGLPLRIAACTAGEEVGGGVLSLPLAGGRLTALRRGARLAQAIATLAPDATVLRWPGALDPSLPGLVNRYGARLVSEHHADESAELRLLGGPWLRLRAEAEDRLGRRLLPRLAGAIGVTGEIRDMLVRRCHARRSCVIANGIDSAAMTPTGFRRHEGGPIEVVFACERFWPWQGLDRLAAGLAAAPEADIIVHLLGEPPRPLPSDARFVIHGRLDGPAADTIYARAHLGIGTLALHRKGLREACTLKTREYLGRGLPFVTAHDDPDVPDGAPWACRLADGEDPLPIAALGEFAGRCRHLDPAQLRADADRLMGWRGKLVRLCDFVREACT